MKLIIGIGNPDPEYLETRHNVGWQFLDWLLKKSKIKNQKSKIESKLDAEVADIEIAGVRAKLIKPLTFVNKSGDAVRKAMKNWKLKTENLIVVHDDLDIPFGMCKLSFEKNSGGHRGVQSVIDALKSSKFFRIRIGTGVRALDKAREQSEKKRDEFVKDFVLKKFTPAQHDELKQIFKDCEVRLLQALKR
ncbi:MAG: aminoacyl-tRNA hydrolase [Patescibacteria group bacterium]